MGTTGANVILHQHHAHAKRACSPEAGQENVNLSQQPSLNRPFLMSMIKGTAGDWLDFPPSLPARMIISECVGCLHKLFKVVFRQKFTSKADEAKTHKVSLLNESSTEKLCAPKIFRNGHSFAQRNHIG